MARKATMKAARDDASRYQRVKAILDKAAGAVKKTDYDGAGRFWDGVTTLKAARVFSIAMIAPEQQASCCDPEPRSVRSGLIKGLRGQTPFDGSRFPPLPWGGTRVADADIAFIADWIDDGLPADSHQRSTIGTGSNVGKPGRRYSPSRAPIV